MNSAILESLEFKTPPQGRGSIGATLQVPSFFHWNLLQLTHQHDGFQFGQREMGGRAVIATLPKARERKSCEPCPSSVQRTAAFSSNTLLSPSQAVRWVFTNIEPTENRNSRHFSTAFIETQKLVLPIVNLPSGYKCLPSGSELEIPG